MDRFHRCGDVALKRLKRCNLIEIVAPERRGAGYTAKRCPTTSLDIPAFCPLSPGRPALGLLFSSAAKWCHDRRCASVQTVTDEFVPHFHNEPGVPVIEIGAKDIHVHRRLATTRSSACLLRHGRRPRVCVPVLLDALSHNSALAPNEARPAECELPYPVIHHSSLAP